MAQRSEPVVEALSALIGQEPFFASLLFNTLEIVETDTLPTAATDSKSIFINPKFFKKLSVPERIFVLAHEVTHVILQHPERMKAYSDLGFGPDMIKFSPGKFNRAADYNINDYLNHLHIGKQPLDTLLNAQYGMNDLVDDIYLKLPDEPEDKSGGGGWDKHMPASDSATDPGTRSAEIQRAVRQAEAAQKAMGTMPAGLQRLIDSVCEPQVRWQDHIQRTIVTLYGSEEATWARVNRRRLAVAPHIPWPRRSGNTAGAIAIEIDTSGSIGGHELEVFLGEVKGVLESVMPEKIYAMYVDSKLFNDEVVELDDVNDLETLKQKSGGGGGTDMTVVFREIEERNLDVECVIVLTDGYTPFGEDCGIPTIWCITTAGVTAPWGETVHVVL